MTSERRSIRALASWLLPPAAIEAVARLARPNRHFHGPLSDWPTGGSYGSGDVELASASVQAVPPSRLTDLLALPAPTSRALVSLLWALASTAEVDQLRVVDFGGGGAPLYYQCRRLVPPAVRIDWRVCDLPEIVSSSVATEELTWTSDLATVPQPIHALVSDGCLQYIERPFDTLRTLAELGAPHMIINRLPCTNGAPLIVRQTLVRDRRRIEFPMHILSRAEFDRSVSDLGLRTLASWVSGPGYRIRYGAKAVDTYGFVLGT